MRFCHSIAIPTTMHGKNIGEQQIQIQGIPSITRNRL